MKRLALRFLTGFAALAGALASCRNLSVCQGTALCEAQSGSAGRIATTAGAPAQGGSAATSGAPAEAAGSAGATEGGAGAPDMPLCQAPLLNCDQTSLNGCETDISNDINHCGACDTACDAVCSRSQCRTPLTLTQMPMHALGPFGVSADYLYFMSAGDAGPYRLWRVDKLGNAPQIVRDDLPPLTNISVAPDRLFLWGDSANLWSVKADGSALDEGLQVSAVAAQSDRVYVVSEGAILTRKTGSENWQARPWFESDASAVELWPVNVNDLLVVFRTVDAAHYDVVLVQQPDLPGGELATLSSGNGRPVRVRSLGDHVYWLARVTDRNSDVYELHRLSAFLDSRDELLAKAPGITDFALDTNFAYVTGSALIGYRIEISSIDNISDKLLLGSRVELTYPESSGDSLWFFDHDLLRRVDLGLDTP